MTTTTMARRRRTTTKKRRTMRWWWRWWWTVVVDGYVESHSSFASCFHCSDDMDRMALQGWSHRHLPLCSALVAAFERHRDCAATGGSARIRESCWKYWRRRDGVSETAIQKDEDMMANSIGALTIVLVCVYSNPFMHCLRTTNRSIRVNKDCIYIMKAIIVTMMYCNRTDVSLRWAIDKQDRWAIYNSTFLRISLIPWMNCVTGA